MMSWTHIIDIGDTAVTLPVAGAIVAWLIAGRAWKAALCWCLMFAAGLSLVASSKIAFLGWDAGVPSLNFQALSGHAFRATAVIPVCFFVLMQGTSMAWRTGGVIVGMVVSLGLGVLLVHFKFHTASEVIASSMLGSSVSLGFMRIAMTLPAPHINRWTAPLSMMVFLGICSLKPSSINHRLVDVALYLSGRDRPHTWSKKCDMQRPPSNIR